VSSPTNEIEDHYRQNKQARRAGQPPQTLPERAGHDCGKAERGEVGNQPRMDTAPRRKPPPRQQGKEPQTQRRDCNEIAGNDRRRRPAHLRTHEAQRE
jgi:hypothetical protein